MTRMDCRWNCMSEGDQGVPCLVALCVVHLLQAGDVAVYHSQAL